MTRALICSLAGSPRKLVCKDPSLERACAASMIKVDADPRLLVGVAIHQGQITHGKHPFRGCFSREPLRRTAFKAIAGRVPGRGFLYFVYVYVFRRDFLDGRDGFVLCLMRAMYQTMVAIKKYDARRRPPGTPASAPSHSSDEAIQRGSPSCGQQDSTVPSTVARESATS